MIEIKNLYKTYAEKTVLQDVSLHIAQGEIHGLLGISGAGKSTLLRCINGLESYTGGSLSVDGVEVGSLHGKAMREFRKHIGMIFQDFALLERKTVLQNILLPMECWHYSKSLREKKALELLNLVGISDKAGCLPRQLSGGQQQRVAIARTLAMEPRVLLCDEATSALDPMTTASVLQLLREINVDLGITIVLVTHQMDVVKNICSMMSIIEAGKIVVTGAVDSILKEQPEALQRFAGSPQIAFPEGSSVFKVSLDAQSIDTPVFSELALNLNGTYQILYAQTDLCSSGKIGHFYIAVDPKRAKLVEDFFKTRNIACASA